MGASNYLRATVLNFTFGKAPYGQPAISVGLSKTIPYGSGSGLKEPEHASYERVPSGFAWELTRLPTAWSVQNTAKIEFPKAEGDWGVVTHWVLFDENNYGVMLAYDELVHEVDIAQDYEVWFKAGALQIALD